MCEKHRALKTDRIKEGIALDRHFKPLIEPCNFSTTAPACAQQRESRASKMQYLLKCERKEEEEQEKGEEASETFERFTILLKSNNRSHDRV